MDRQQFDALVSGVIRPNGEIILASTLVNGSPSITWVPGWQDALYESYQQWRDQIHSQKAPPQVGKPGRIDRHKVAAALMLSILGSMPFQFCEGAETNALSVYLANEILALRVGVHVVIEFLRAVARSERDTRMQFILRRPIVFPTVAKDADDYCLQTYRALYLLRERPGLASLLLLSNLLFVLESFHIAHGAGSAAQ